MEKKLFTKPQILGMTFFAGPLAAIYTLNRNFQVLGKAQAAKNTSLSGVPILLCVLLLALSLPENFPGIVLTVAYCTLTASYFQKTQASDVDEALAIGATRQGGGTVFLAALVCLVVTVVLLFTTAFGLAVMGVLD